MQNKRKTNDGFLSILCPCIKIVIFVMSFNIFDAKNRIIKHLKILFFDLWFCFAVAVSDAIRCFFFDILFVQFLIYLPVLAVSVAIN